MESERFSSSRASLGFPPDRRAATETAAQRQTPAILERFRAMIRGREEDNAAGSDGEDEPSPPTAGEIVGFYEEFLSELTYNSKPIITDLTVIAGEQREHAEGIVDAICVRILEAPVDQKLPSLYLLDSIVKNIGREYMRHFAARLPKVFCEAYNQVHSSLHPAMRHLFGTWSQVFPSSVLCKIEDGLQRGTPGNQRSTSLEDTRHSESPSPRPSHGIHVNPKYLEARHRFEHPASDVQHVSGVSSSLQDYGQKSSNQYGDYDFEHAETLPPRIAMTRAGSPLAAARSSSVMGGEGPFSRSKNRGSRPSSPPRIGVRSISPAGDRFQGDASPGRVFERNSPSHSGIAFGNCRMSDQNGWLERRRLTDDAAQQRDAPTGFNLKNGYGKQRSRELIDAYGNYRGKDAINEKHSKIQRLDVNGMNSEAFTRKWQNSEEEEYVWENMSPTLSDRSRNIVPPFGCYNERARLKGPDDRVLEPDFRRNGHLDHAPLPRVDDPLTIFDDRNPVLGPGQRPMSKQYLDGKGSQNEPFLHFKSAHHMQELGKLPYSFPHYTQQSLSPKSRGRVLPMPSSVASIDQNLPAPYDNFPDGEVPFLGLPGVRSDTLNVDTSAYNKNLLQRPYSPHIASGLWPPVHNSQPLPSAPIPPNQKHIKSSFEFVEGNRPILNKVPTSSLFLPMRKYDAADRKIMDPNKLYQLPYQHSDLIHVNQQRQEVGAAGIHSKEAHGSFIPPAPTHFFHPRTQGEGVPTGSAFSNSLSNRPVSVGNRTVADSFSHAHSGSVPPLPPGPPPPSSHMGPSSQNIGSIVSSSPAATFSGLISNLMAQGLISLKPPDQSQDSVGVEFNVELLKVRHESIINALYADLPRQCTTCGLRFKCQEEHSSHMDWHVTKNRISKNRKQKSSRKWFVNVKEWLSGAETVGTDASPGFLPSEAVTEKKEDNEMAVPADEDQNECALCAEPFEDFYSDETEEWMYKGAVYMNAPNGKIDGLDRSQLGPIVHAKCRSQTAEDIGQA